MTADNKQAAPSSVRNMQIHTTSTTPTENDPNNREARAERASGGSSSAPSRRPLTDSTERHSNDSNKRSPPNSASTVSTPTSSQCTILNRSAIMDKSRKYLENLIECLESGKHSVDMFVLLLQNMGNGDEELRKAFDQTPGAFAVRDMIEEAIQRMIKKRDDIPVDGDEGKEEKERLDNIVAELILQKEVQ